MENMDWLERQLSGAVGEDGEVGLLKVPLLPLLWGFQIRTSLDVELLKQGWVANGLDLNGI